MIPGAATVAALGAVGFRLIATGNLTLDTGIGRRVRPLDPLSVAIAAPRETVFDVIAAPYLGRTPRALSTEIEVLERGSDMVVAAHRTPVGRGTVTTTAESVRFARPDTVSFRLLRGSVVVGHTGRDEQSTNPPPLSCRGVRRCHRRGAAGGRVWG
jgi:hypothetical protein